MAGGVQHLSLHVRSRAEVQQQADVDVGRPEVGQHLGVVFGGQVFDRLQLDDDAPFDEEVREVLADFDALVVHLDRRERDDG